MEPGGSMMHSQGSPIIPILSRINPIPRIHPISLRGDCKPYPHNVNLRNIFLRN